MCWIGGTPRPLPLRSLVRPRSRLARHRRVPQKGSPPPTEGRRAACPHRQSSNDDHHRSSAKRTVRGPEGPLREKRKWLVGEFIELCQKGILDIRKATTQSDDGKVPQTLIKLAASWPPSPGRLGHIQHRSPRVLASGQKNPPLISKPEILSRSFRPSVR
jgi:hypothetical protein